MQIKSFILTKTTVECYKIRQQDRFPWANITVDASESAGRIQIASGYGSWEHYWGACGKGFKEFLIGLDIHYTAAKFGEGRWFDQDATIEVLKKSLKEYDGSKSEKGQMMDEVLSLEDYNKEDYNREDTFVYRAYKCKTLHKLWDSGPDIKTGISPSFLSFWEKIWPVFIAELKKELE